MGNHLVVAAPSMVLPVERHVAELPEFKYEKSLGSTRFMKVAAAMHSEGPAVIKVIALHDSSVLLRRYKQKVDKITAKLKSSLNCCPFTSSVVTEKAGFLVRPFGKDTLYDRLSTRPFLIPLEKLWIVFQLLKALAECETARVCHGDIKCENVLVSSSMWAQLVDFACYKPTYLPYDNPADFSFFFDIGRRRTCYVAPERFLSSAELNQSQESPVVLTLTKDGSTHRTSESPHPHSIPLQHSMDVFSLGCVFVELMTDGCAPFDFTQMLSFRQGGYSPQPLIDKIECTHLRELVGKMLSPNPKARPTASELLQQQRGKAFPELFYSVLYPYMAELSTRPLKICDDKIKKLSGDLPDILSACEQSNSDDNPLLVIIVSLILSCLRTLNFCRQKMDAIQMLTRLAKFMPSEVILDRILPYLLSMLKDVNPTVRAGALDALVHCLDCVKWVPQSDLRLFSEYLIPRLEKLIRDPSGLVRIVLARQLANIAQLSIRFVKLACDNAVVDPQVVQEESQESSFEQIRHEEMASIRNTIQDMVVHLLSGSHNAIKRALVSSGLLRQMCEFFGRQTSSDVLLSHMITFLNDKLDWQLRACFFENVYVIAEFVGWQSAIILRPLLQQGLRDFEELVTHQALVCLSQLCKRDALKKPTVFEVASEAMPMLCHPNLMIRIAAVNFVATLAETQKLADVHCKLEPMVRPYLKHKLIKYDNHNLLLQSLHAAIPREVYDLIVPSPCLEAFFAYLQDKRFLLKLDRASAAANREAQQPAEPVLKELYKKLSIRGLTDEVEERLLAFSDILLKMHKFRVSVSSERTPASAHSPGVVSIPKQCSPRHVELSKLSSQSSSSGLTYRTFTPNEEWQEMFGAPAEMGIQIPPLSSTTVKSSAINSRNAAKSGSPVPSLNNSPRHDTNLSHDMNKGRMTPIAVKTDVSSSSSYNKMTHHNTMPHIELVNQQLTGGLPGATSGNLPNLVENVVVVDSPKIATRIVHTSSGSNDAIPSGAVTYQDNVGGRLIDAGFCEGVDAVKVIGLSPMMLAKSPDWRESLAGETVTSQRPSNGENPPVVAASATSAIAETGSVSSTLNGTGKSVTGSVSSDQSTLSQLGKFSMMDDGLLSQSIQNATQDATGFIISECEVELSIFLEWKREELMRLNRSTSVSSHRALQQQCDDGMLSHNKHPVRSGRSCHLTNQPANGWKPRGILVAHVHEHRGPVNRLSLHPNGCVFASCSSDGTVKLWDCQRMEGPSMANRSRATYSGLGGKIKDVAFMGDGGDTLVAAADSGAVQLLKIENGNKITPVSTFRVDLDSEGPPLCFDAHSIGNVNYVIMAVHHGQVICWDTRQPEPAWRFVNKSKYGLVTGFAVGPHGQHWATLGTSTGYLVTWDLRFLLPINITHHPAHRPVNRLFAHPVMTNAAVACFGGNGEVSVWDLEASSRSLALWASEKPLLAYAERDESTTNAVQWSSDPDYPFAITGDSNSAIRFWDLKNARNSALLSARGDWRLRQYLYKNQVIDGVEVLSESSSYARPSSHSSVSSNSVGSRKSGSSGGNFGGSTMTGLGYLSQGKSPLETVPTVAHHDVISDLLIGHTTQWFLISSSRDGVIKVWK